MLLIWSKSLTSGLVKISFVIVARAMGTQQLIVHCIQCGSRPTKLIILYLREAFKPMFQIRVSRSQKNIIGGISQKVYQESVFFSKNVDELPFLTKYALNLKEIFWLDYKHVIPKVEQNVS